MFNDGFNPVKQCMTIVEVSATTDASDAAVSCTPKVSLLDRPVFEMAMAYPNERPR